MATYDELLTASENAALLKKIRVACVVAAETIRMEAGDVANHANRLVWAKQAFIAPEETAKRMLWAVLAQNKSVSLSQITGASDTTVQAAVDAAVNVFATGA